MQKSGKINQSTSSNDTDSPFCFSRLHAIDWLIGQSVCPSTGQNALFSQLFSVPTACKPYNNLTSFANGLYSSAKATWSSLYVCIIKQKKFNAFALFLTKNLLAHLFFLQFVANFSLPPWLLFLLFFPQLQLGLIKNHPIIRLSDSDDSFSNYFLF